MGIRRVIGIVMFTVMLMIVCAAFCAGLLRVAVGQEPPPTVEYGTVMLDVKLTRGLWDWLQPHITEVCQAKPFRFVDVSINEVNVGLGGSFEALKCAKEVIDREQKLNRYAERLSYYRNLGKRNIVASGNQDPCRGCKCNCKGVPCTK